LRRYSQHIVNEKISGVERGAVWLLERVRLLGPHCMRWAESVIPYFCHSSKRSMIGENGNAEGLTEKASSLI
jgi:hypothetical protein